MFDPFLLLLLFLLFLLFLLYLLFLLLILHDLEHFLLRDVLVSLDLMLFPVFVLFRRQLSPVHDVLPHDSEIECDFVLLLPSHLVAPPLPDAASHQLLELTVLLHLGDELHLLGIHSHFLLSLGLVLLSHLVEFLLSVLLTPERREGTGIQVEDAADVQPVFLDPLFVLHQELLMAAQSLRHAQQLLHDLLVVLALGHFGVDESVQFFGLELILQHDLDLLLVLHLAHGRRGGLHLLRLSDLSCEGPAGESAECYHI